MDNLNNLAIEKNLPKTLRIIFRVLGGAVFFVAALSFIAFCLLFIFYFYQETYGIILLWWMPFFALGLTGIAFVCGWGLWKYQKWSVILFSVIFGEVLAVQIARFIGWGNFSSVSLLVVVTALVITGGLFALTFFLRRYLKGAYFKWLPFSLFIGFFLINQLSYPLYLLTV